MTLSDSTRRRGATAIEYCLAATLVCIVAIATIQRLGVSLEVVFDHASQPIQDERNGRGHAKGHDKPSNGAQSPKSRL